MNLIRYEPWSALRRISRDFDGMFDPTYNADRPVHWVPAIDIRETSDSYVLTADLPGIDPKDIDITMEDGRLTLRGERVSHSEQKEEGYSRTERVSGTFLRRFDLPETSDAEGVKASSHNGVLTVVIPKKPEVQPRRITVDVA